MELGILPIQECPPPRIPVLLSGSKKRASVLLREILGLSAREIPWQLGSKSVMVFVACDQVTALSSQWLVLFRGLATIGI